MIVSYDFHIHTVASPCGDELMTPNNIINLCELLEKKIIAITDHNTCCNCAPIMALGKEKDILVIPGMEIECMEEFHLIALFPNLENAYEAEKQIQACMPKIKNRASIFGNQWIMNTEDEVIGEMERMLLTATQLSVYELVPLVKGLSGCIYPAHIDRNAYSILSNLGAIPDDLYFDAFEVSKNAKDELYKGIYPGMRCVKSSDAHYLEQLCEGESFLEVEKIDKKSVFEWLKLV